MKKHKILDWIGLVVCVWVLVFVLLYAGGNNQALVLWLAIGSVSLFGGVRGITV